jgi:hypothetical protein
MEHFYKSVNGFFDEEEFFKFAVDIMPQDAPSIFVEIGAFLGRSTSYLAVEIINSKKPITLYVVDTWQGSPDEIKESGGWGPNHVDFFAEWFRVNPGKDSMYEAFLKNVEPVLDYITPLRMPSVEASELFDYNSLDFVYIDGDHSWKCINEDLLSWKNKVKYNGLLAGDDYPHGRVSEAVRLHIPNVVIVGSKSWMRPLPTAFTF